MIAALEKLFEQLSKLVFGFALGAGLGGVSFIILNLLTPTTISPLIFIYSGGVIGLGLNRLVNSFVNSALKPFDEHIKSYFKLLEIIALKTVGVLSKKRARILAKKIIVKNFSYEDIKLKSLNIPIKKLPQKKEEINMGKLKILMKKLHQKEEELTQKEKYIEEYISTQKAKNNTDQMPALDK